MIKDIRHTGIVVNNLESSLLFYSELLGFKVVRRMQESGTYLSTILAIKNTAVTTVKMETQTGQMIELLKFHYPPSAEIERSIYDLGISHLALTVDNLNALYKQLSAKGIAFLSSPQVSPDNYARVVFCRDP